MARETKVGLLAGLAFIICFAIILANRGQPITETTHRPYLVDRGVNARRVAEEPTPSTSSNAPIGRNAVYTEPNGRVQTPPQKSSHLVRADRVGANRATGGSLGSGAVVLLPGLSAVFNSSDEKLAANSLLEQQSDSLATGEPEHSVSPSEWARRKLALQQLLDARAQDANTPADSGRLRQSSGDQPALQRVATVQSPTDRSARYKVKAGDTLSAIAASHYGTRSAKVVKALFEANRSVLSTPDLLSVGVELVLPSVEGLGISSPALRSNTANTPTQQERRSGQQTRARQSDFRWYQIKRNDRYIGIAREQLGDANRWSEIFELNKDKFPDPQRIRPGVRIKIPSGRVASSRSTQ